jgi:glycosyltransferase involved in cell wall biosynthesis
VLHVLNGAGGGATLSTVELAQALAVRGFEPHAVCHAGHGTVAERRDLLDMFGGRVTFVPLYFWNRRVRTAPAKRVLVVARQEVRTGHGLVSAARVRDVVEERRIDLVHSGIAIVPDGAVAARSLGLPHVMHVRELLGPDQPFRIPGEGRRLARVLGGPHDRLVANSQTTASLLARAVPGLDVDIVPNGLDLARFDPVADDHDEARPVRVVAMVANLYSTWKRHDLFVDAAAIVARRHPELEFRIYGHRDYAASDAYVDDLISRAAAEGLTSKLVLAGYLSDPTEMMRGIDLLVQPTSAESFGRVVVEAMASKVGVVGVGEGPLGELVEHERSGLLAGDSTPEALAEVITRFVEDQELRAKAVARARLRAHELFSIERCADRMATIYESMLRGGPGPGEPLVRSWARYSAGRFVP